MGLIFEHFEWALIMKNINENDRRDQNGNHAMPRNTKCVEKPRTISEESTPQTLGFSLLKTTLDMSLLIKFGNDYQLGLCRYHDK